MRRVTFGFWGLLAALVMLWIAADPGALALGAFLPFRNGMVQITGILAWAA